jgi:hypothetical protein
MVKSALATVLLCFSVCTCICFSPAAHADRLAITLESGTEAEKTAKALLEDLAKTYDVSRFLFTERVHIQSFSIPHSHPVLTLNTRSIKEPDRFLSLFLHEQIHWFFAKSSRDQKVEAFIVKMKELFPTVPSQAEGGAQDEESTYLHLGVCYYELEALTSFIGVEKAQAVFKTNDIYKWINQQVLTEGPQIHDALKATGLELVAAQSEKP